jgi:apoptosis-resistant E3 ubiquitin protein ligase 1
MSPIDPTPSPSFGSVFVIDDGSQPRIELSSKDRNLIAATFTHFLIKNIGGSETFKDKQDFFYHEVRKHHSNSYHEKISLKVQREKILESSMKATKNFAGKKKLVIIIIHISVFFYIFHIFI